MLWDLQIERYGEQYQDLSWGPIIGLIKEDQAAAGKQHHNASKEKAVIKERFTTINTGLQARALCITMWTACLHLKQGLAACGTLCGHQHCAAGSTPWLCHVCCDLDASKPWLS